MSTENLLSIIYKMAFLVSLNIDMVEGSKSFSFNHAQ